MNFDFTKTIINGLKFWTKEFVEDKVTSVEDKITASETNSKTYIDNEISSSEESTKSYVDDALMATEDEIKTYTDEQISSSEESTKTYVDNKISEVIGGAPELLNTLDELSEALNDDENFATTVANQIAEKQDKLIFDFTPTIDSTNPVTSGGVKSYVDEQVGSIDIPEQLQANLSEADETNKAYVSGVLQQRHLPDGYPYEEVEKVEKSTNAKKYYPVTGDMITVAYNDEEYTLEVKNADGTYYTDGSSVYGIKYVGNTTLEIVDTEFLPAEWSVETLALSTLQHDDVPFCIIWGNDSQLDEQLWSYIDGSFLSKSDFKLYANDTTIVPMAEKFLPSTVVSQTYVDTSVANLVNAAPETLDTLGELATAFQENKEVVDALDSAITTKQDKITDALILTDAVTGSQYKVQIQNGQLVSFPVE